jgi:Ca-activated chloride channel homolog
MYQRLCIVFLGILIISVHAGAQVQEVPARPQPSVSYGLVVDNSGSYRHFLERVITFTRQVAETNVGEDELFLVTFVDTTKIVVRQELTSNKLEIQDAAENMYIEGGQTAVLDAVRLSIDYLAANAKGGTAKIEQVIASAKGAKIKIVVLGMSDEKLNTKLLDRLSRETGGTAFYPKSIKEMSEVAGLIAATIRGSQTN